MTQREYQIYQRTRDRRFLLRSALALGAVFTLLGIAAGWWREAHPGVRMMATIDAGGVVVDPMEALEGGPAGVANEIRELAVSGEGAADLRHTRATTAIAVATISAADAARLRLLADGLLGDVAAQDRAIDSLRKAAAEPAPRRFDREWFGDVLSRRQEFDQAAVAYESEGRAFREAVRARARAFELALNRDQLDHVRRWLADPEMTRDLPGWMVAQAEARCGNPGALLLATLRAQTARWTPLFHSLTALLTGALWWLIFARIAGVPPRRWWLAFVGLLLGVLSTTLTLGAGIMFPVRFDEEGNFAQRALFFILGVGLREEAFKLICALPLILGLRRESSAHVVLLSLCAVGIGFAVEENTGYFEAGPSPAWSRFLTANFLHLAWTGLLGFSLWRALRGSARGWEEFAATFLLVVISHGAYDLCFGDLLEENLSILSIVILIAVAFRFFAQLRSVAATSRQVVSPLAVFLLGSVALLGLAFVGLCGTLGLRTGGGIVLGQALCTAPMAFLFIREFRED